MVHLIRNFEPRGTGFPYTMGYFGMNCKVLGYPILYTPPCGGLVRDTNNRFGFRYAKPPVEEIVRTLYEASHTNYR